MDATHPTTTTAVPPPAPAGAGGGRQPLRARVRRYAPGTAAILAATVLALAAPLLSPVATSAGVAVLLGALVRSTGLFRASWAPATTFTAKRVLRIAVVLLGLQLPLSQVEALGWDGAALVLVVVVVTFFGTLLLGRALRVPPARALLVATGFSICGASAIAAVRPVTDADDEDTSTAVALVTLCGTLAIVVLPLLVVPLGLDAHTWGVWAGASIHDVGQAVAAGALVSGALTTVVVVKLSRVLLLAPLVALVGIARRRSQRGTGVSAATVPLVPLFLLGFVAAVALRATGWVPPSALGAAAHVQEVLLVASLFALGTGIDVPRLVRTGGRSLALGLMSWLLVAGTALAGVHLVYG